MALQYRTIRVAASALLIAVAIGAGGMTGMASALAAEPPVDVVLDATVTVNLIPPAHTGSGLVGALIRLEAYRTEGEPFQTLETSSTDGATATFDGVARAADGAPDVLLDVFVAFSYERTDELGCIERGGQSGSANGIVASDGLAIDIDNWASSIFLPDCTGVADLDDGVVTVRFIDQLTLLPVAGATVTIGVSHPEVEEGTATATLIGTTDANGVATIEGVPYRPHDLPGVELEVRAHKIATWTDAASGCTGSDTWDAARVGVVGAAAVEIAFTADEQSASSSLECGPNPTPSGDVGGATGTPGSGGNAGLTPPPTDALALRAAAQPDRLGAALTLGFLIGLIAAALLLSPRPGSRRRR